MPYQRPPGYYAAYLARRRLRLINLLGGKCVDCGEEDATKLEFDHREPRTWIAREVWAKARLKLYEAEAAAGKIQLKCGPCNKKRPYLTPEIHAMLLEMQADGW